MSDERQIVQHYIAKLGDSAAADDACWALHELGPSALPHILEGLRSAGDRDVRRRLTHVVCHSHWPAALPLFSELLRDRDPEVWKSALDVLVWLAWDDADMRPEILDILRVRREMAPAEEGQWIEEAMDQVSWPDKSASG